MQSLQDHFLIAMPAMADPNFNETVTYICKHDVEGAFGLVITRPSDLSLGEMFKHLCLRGGARKAVQNIAIATIVLRRSLFDDANHDLVGNQSSGLLNVADFICEGRVRLCQRAKNVAGRNLRQTHPLLQQTRLRAFAGTRRAD